MDYKHGIVGYHRLAEKNLVLTSTLKYNIEIGS